MLIDRLWSKINTATETGCWEWTACRDQNGYGHIMIDRKKRLAHRISYELHCGAIPDGIFVCHHCDNPSCVNPDHLFLGTNADNMADMTAKGRGKPPPKLCGASHARSKLTEADVNSIRAAKGMSLQAIANRFGVQKAQIYRIRSGKSWTHLHSEMFR